mgnify:CR=1 FL=1
MKTTDVIKSRRTIRKFKQDRIELSILKELVDGARLAPSASNRQPLEYMIVEQPELLEPVFQTVRWAGYIAPRGNPREGEKPVAYIVVLVKKELDSPLVKYDVGAAVQNILLGAWEQGIGSCWIASVDREKLRGILDIPDRLNIDCVIALGYPAQKSFVEDECGTIVYRMDEDGTMHVPKRKLEDVLHIAGRRQTE